MYSLEEIKKRSVTEHELVVDYSDVMELLHIFEKSNIQVLGWEGWLVYQDGSLGHSQQHQGTVDLSDLKNISAIEFVKSTIMQAKSEWDQKPEVNSVALLYCITTNT
jgi:hypothetical protein